MSQENVKQYHRVAEAFERRDLDAFLAFFDPDVDFAPRSAAVHGGSPFRGHEGVRSCWESMFSVFSDYVAEIDEVQDLGDVTFGRARLSASTKRTRSDNPRSAKRRSMRARRSVERARLMQRIGREMRVIV